MVEKHPSVRKPLRFVGSSLDDLRSFPDEVKRDIGFALDWAQCGDKHTDAKPLKRVKGAGVLEVVERFDGNTYRAVYTVKFKGMVYLLHAFQKKSKKGIATPKADMDLIESRLKAAQEDYEAVVQERTA